MRRALLLALAGLLSLGAAEAPEREVQVRFLMGTLWTVEAEGPGAEAALARAFAEIRRLDDLLSTYKPDSELSRINRTAATQWAPAGPETLALLARAFDYAETSGGAFDPTVGPLVEAWGFKHQDFKRPPKAALEAARKQVGYRHVTLDPKRGVRFARAGMSLDLGAIAKGYAVDRALAGLSRDGMVAARVDAGGNQGVFGRPPALDTWLFGIKHPREEDAALGVVGLSAGGISTSGDAERGFWLDGVRYGHVIDPRSGMPAQHVLSATVTAPTAEAADALSTTLCVLGIEAGLAYLEAHHRAARAIFVEPDGSTGRFRVRPQAGIDWRPARAVESYDVN